MPTGRQVFQQALREPMRSQGWNPRAAGWFTSPIAVDHTGVIAVGVASDHHLPGSAQATLHVKLRREDVEPVVQELCQITDVDGGYRSTTTTTSIGYLLPDDAWRDWLVTPATADAVAAELAAAVHDYGRPYLARLAADHELLLDTIKRSARHGSAIEPCRVAVLLARLGRPDEGWAFMADHLEQIASRTDAAAAHTRDTAARLRSWLND